MSDGLGEFAVELLLPQGSSDELSNAKMAIKTEHRGAAETLTFRCRRVEDVGQRTYRLTVGRSLPADWTWEGSVASGATGSDTDSWRGHVVEVDNINGAVFVAVETDTEPRPGAFTVRPFDFLVSLNHVFNGREVPKPVSERLQSSLAATRGGIHPEATGKLDAPAPLSDLWRHSWAILWGPPGTGKTHRLGELVGRVVSDAAERVLVVSTTNRATDEAALSIVDAMRRHDPGCVLRPTIVRIGSGARFKEYERRDAIDALAGSETELRRKLDAMRDSIRGQRSSELRAELNRKMKRVRASIRNATIDAVRNCEHRVVVSTMYRAGNLLRNAGLLEHLAEGRAPFSTVIIDEAGLVSRVAVATLSLLAARRLILIGDPCQLSPISKMCRALHTNQAMWLAESALNHLRSPTDNTAGVELLEQQYRMAPHIRAAVSELTYEGRLTDDESIQERDCPLPAALADGPRAIWYVLDEALNDPVHVRAERAPSGRGWAREAGRGVLDRLFRANPELRGLQGLYVTPFSSQARDTGRWLDDAGHAGWTASTVHRQQGTQFDIVVFDTVHASGTSWPYEEWRRLVNVGLSRAKHLLILIASRDEMTMPFLAPLVSTMSPQVLRHRGSKWEWVSVDPTVSAPELPDLSQNPALLGAQIAKQRSLRPVLSAEQERLCRLKMDGKPRLVRGVAGSGKTLVLARWLCQVIGHQSDRLTGKVWVVFGNRSLEGLLRKTIEAGWSDVTIDRAFPWPRVEILHIKDVLKLLFNKLGKRLPPRTYDYEKLARTYFRLVQRDSVEPLCDALFIDEAQDMGHTTLDLLTRLTRTVAYDEGEGKAVHIFYDNAQNLYDRSTPKWSDIGLDMRGRSTVMKESFRSTREITEFATNLLYRLQDPEKDEDYRELVSRKLVEKSRINGRQWWSVHFNHVSGPLPDFSLYKNRQAEFRALADDIACLIKGEGVSPIDICVLYNGLGNQLDKLLRVLNNTLGELGARAIRETNQAAFTRRRDTVLVTTPHSFKGYEAEVICVVGLDRFVVDDRVLAPNAYVACTRARSVLRVYASKDARGQASQRLIQTAEEVLDDLYIREPDSNSHVGALNDLVDVLGEEHRGWLEGLDNNFEVHQAPIYTPGGVVLAEPLFWLEQDGTIYACFEDEPSRRARHQLEDAGVQPLGIGDEPG